ncbi:hypothetical protein ACHAWU_001480 [Discostella pseudostelligera]|uniref:PAS domain-containing protein n=1 Tax=Discostella pseudostelligera TaxID=259834 RepID=A0ABD3MQR8_9STRA
MKLSDLREWLSAAKSTVHSGNDSEKNNSIDDIDSTDSNNSIIVPPFEPTKRLRENDYTILDMLHSAGHENVSFCITDPHLPDNPVIYISEGFVRLTGYEYDEVVGKNCRFLQGPETEEQDRKRIFDAVKTEKECSVNLLNYKKDGTKFVNEPLAPTAADAALLFIASGIDHSEVVVAAFGLSLVYIFAGGSFGVAV